MENTRISGAEILLRSLITEGVDTMFGYPGGTIMPLYDELYGYRDRIRHILVRHEQGAVHAAQGYARASGKTGVCMATAGPGATNLVTGIADASMDSTPVVCITAQVAVDNLGTDYFQEADTISITGPITKWSYEITRADEVAVMVKRAFAIARSGRPGPVLISITRNAQVEKIQYVMPSGDSGEIVDRYSPDFSDDGICGAVELLNNAERPMIIVGQGVTISGAGRQVLELSEEGNIPVVSTLMGLSSFPTEHPLFIGNVGMHGNYAPNMMTQKSDLILAIGMRFSDRVTGDTGSYAPCARIIHVDIDRGEIGKRVRADLALIGDAREVVSLLLPDIEFKDRQQWLGCIEELKKSEREKITVPLLKRNDGKMSMASVVNTVAELGRGEAVVVTDVGQHQMFSALYSRFSMPRSFITSGGLGTMGYGLPAAMGAKMAVPEREVVLFVGDGGIQMSIQELGTIMQSGIAVKIVLLNNGYLGMVRQWQEMFFDRRYSFTNLESPDYMKIAEAYGMDCLSVDRYGALRGAVRRMLDSEGPFLLEVKVDPGENVFPMVPAGASLDEILM